MIEGALVTFVKFARLSMLIFASALLCGKDEVIINFLAVTSCAAFLIKVFSSEITLLRIKQLVGHILSIIHAVDLRLVREINRWALGFPNVWLGEELFEEAHCTSNKQ